MSLAHGNQRNAPPSGEDGVYLTAVPDEPAAEAASLKRKAAKQRSSPSPPRRNNASAMDPLEAKPSRDSVEPWPMDLAPAGSSSPGRSPLRHKKLSRFMNREEREEAMMQVFEAGQDAVNKKYWQNVRHERREMEKLLENAKQKMRENLAAAGYTAEQLDEERIIFEASSPQKSTVSQSPQRDSTKRREENTTSRPSVLQALDPAIADFIMEGTVRNARIPKKYKREADDGKPAFR